MGRRNRKMSADSSPVVKTRASARHSTGTSPRLRSPLRTGSSLVHPAKRRVGTGLRVSPGGLSSQASPGSHGTKRSRALVKGTPGQSGQKTGTQSAKGKLGTSPAAGSDGRPTPSASPSPAGSAQSTPGSKGAGIRTRLSTGSIHMNGTTTVSAAKEKAELEMIIQQISKDTTPIQKSTPGSSGSSKRRVSSSQGGAANDAQPDHPPPKKRKIGRNDGSGEDNRNDYFCWMCHKEGTLVCCELCPRVYHIRCLGIMGELPQDWVCPECEKIMRAECVDTRSKAMEMLTIDQLCILLKYALERMKHQGSDPFKKAVDPALVPNYSDYIFNPMDLSIIEKNIRKKQYGCTEAFLADARWILHNCIIYNGAHHNLTNSAKMIMKICKHETAEIELCPDCYLNSCIRKNDEWFSEPCRVPHTLVWAKLKGYPFWPAKALREMEGQVDVRFFGAHDRSWVPVSQCFLLSKNIPTSLQKGKKNAGLSGAISELHIHINKLRERFGNFEYAPFRTPYDKTDSYKPINPKPSSGIPFYSPKSGQNQQKKSAAAKTASALKSKYSHMATSKKMETTPKKIRKDTSAVAEESCPEKDTNSARGDTGVVANDHKESKKSEIKTEKEQTLDSESAHRGKTIAVSENDSAKGNENPGVKSNEGNTGKKSFLDSNIVDRLAKKIQALNDEVSEEKDSKNESSSKDLTREEKLRENDEANKSGKEDTSFEKAYDSLDRVSGASEAKYDDIKEFKSKRDTGNLSEENTKSVILPDDKQNELSSNHDNGITSGKASGEDHTNSKDKSEEKNKETKIENTANASVKEPVETDKKESASKEAYKKKLESTILSCKAKLGMEKKLEGQAEGVIEIDLDEASEKSEADSDSGGEWEECGDSDSCEDLEMEVDEIEPEDTDEEEGNESDEDIETVANDNKSSCVENTENDSKNGNNVVKDDLAKLSSECPTAKVSMENDNKERVNAIDEKKESTSVDVKETDKETAPVKESASEKCENTMSVKEMDSQKDKTTTDRENEDVKSREPQAKTQKACVDNYSVAVNEQTVKASVQQVLTKSTPDKAAGSTENGASQQTVQPMKQKGSAAIPPGRIDLVDSDVMEEDSETDRLVIDLDSESDTSPRKSVCIRKGGSAKTETGFGKTLSRLVGEVKKKDRGEVKKREGAGLVKQNNAPTTSQLVSSGSAKLPVPSAKPTIPKPVQAAVEQPPVVASDKLLIEERPSETGIVRQKSTDSSADSDKPGTGAPVNKLAEKFSKKLMSNIQKTVDEMCVEMLRDQESDQLPSDVQRQLDQLHWDYKAELKELKHNFDLTISEMKCCWESEKEQLTKKLKEKHMAEMEKQIAETKKKQWCAQCGKEAIFYCCWNTSYCDYPCQQSHWPQHLHTCLQTNKDKAVTAAGTQLEAGASKAPIAATSTVPASAGVISSTGPVHDLTSKANSQSSNDSSAPSTQVTAVRQMLQDKLTAAMYHEEEKRGEGRSGISPKYIPMSSPINTHPRQSTPSAINSSLLFPTNMVSSSTIVHPPQATVMQAMPRNLFINQQMAMPPQRMALGPARPVGGNMILPQPVLQQQALYPVQQQQLGGTILFQNPQQQNLMGYGIRPPF